MLSGVRIADGVETSAVEKDLLIPDGASLCPWSLRPYIHFLHDI